MAKRSSSRARQWRVKAQAHARRILSATTSHTTINPANTTNAGTKTGYDFLLIYLTLEDYTEHWDRYGAPVLVCDFGTAFTAAVAGF